MLNSVVTRYMRRRNNPGLGTAAMLLLIPAVLGAIFTGKRKRKRKASGSSTVNPMGGYPDPRPIDRGIPFARGATKPMWPIDMGSKHHRKLEVPYKDVEGKWHGNMARAFRASRGSRYHVGCDLYAHAGDVVLAPEAGEIVRTQSFKDGTHAMMLQTNSGVNILLGEIEKGSWNDFNVGKGSRVVRGQPVAVVGLQDSNPNEPGVQGGAHMLHIELYKCCPDRNIRWSKHETPSELILDPTDYLLRARAAVTAIA